MVGVWIRRNRVRAKIQNCFSHEIFCSVNENIVYGPFNESALKDEVIARNSLSLRDG